jgi:hypothetical protein
MNKLKLLLRNINLLNIILIVSVVLVAGYMVLPMLNIKVKFNPAISKKILTTKDETTSESQTQSPSDFLTIAEQNLFHPQRIIPPEKKEEQPLQRPEFVLYGTLVADDISVAYMEDKKSPRTTPGRGKRQTALKKGDTMSGYTLKEIDPEQVIMVRGEETLIVKIIDPNVKKDREGGSTPIPQAQAISPEQKALREKALRATPQPTRPEQATTPARKTPYQPNK